MNLEGKSGCHAEREGNRRRLTAHLKNMLEQRFLTRMGGIVFVRQVRMAIGTRRVWLTLHRVTQRLVNVQCR